ncbi:MAG TPA: MFS transporter, partial [Acidobacteriota bacterium]|nr:MFS transporter [Acidobacteriota bacterium]
MNVRTILFSRSFLLIFFSFFFLWISFDFFILFPLFILERGGNSVDVGIQTAIFFFPSVILRPIAGWITDRTGRVKTIWAGTVLMILTSFAFLFLPGSYQDFKVLCAIILFLRGLGFSLFYVAFFTYTADLAPIAIRARIIGLFGVSGLVAHGCAPKVAELVLRYWKFTGYFVASGLLATFSLIIALFLKEQPYAKSEEGKAFHSLRNVTFNIRNLIVLPGAFTFGFAVASFNTFGAAYFQKIPGTSVGYFFLLYGSMAGLIRVLFGGFADRYPRWKLVGIFFAMQAAGLMFVIWNPVQVNYLIGAAIAGAAHGILFPTMAAMAVDAHPPENRGLITSV